MGCLLQISKRGYVNPKWLHNETLEALERRGMVERFVPDEVNGQPALFDGVHPEMVRLSEEGRKFATLARLGVKKT